MEPGGSGTAGRAEVPEDVLLIFRETTAAEINNKMSAILLPRQNQTPI